MEGFIEGMVDTTSTPVTIESLKAAIEKIQAEQWEPHRHLFNPECRSVDGVYICVDCGAPFEFIGGSPVLSY